MLFSPIQESSNGLQTNGLFHNNPVHKPTLSNCYSSHSAPQQFNGNLPQKLLNTRQQGPSIPRIHSYHNVNLNSGPEAPTERVDDKLQLQENPVQKIDQENQEDNRRVRSRSPFLDKATTFNIHAPQKNRPHPTTTLPTHLTLHSANQIQVPPQTHSSIVLKHNHHHHNHSSQYHIHHDTSSLHPSKFTFHPIVSNPVQLKKRNSKPLTKQMIGATFKYNQIEASRMLGVSLTTLKRKFKQCFPEYKQLGWPYRQTRKKMRLEYVMNEFDEKEKDIDRRTVRELERLFGCKLSHICDDMEEV